MQPYLKVEVVDDKMIENKPGIIMPDGSFISKQDIDRKAMMEGRANLVTDMPLVRDFNYWAKRFEERQTQYKESETRQNNVEISFSEEPIINFWGDLHVGAPDTDYRRINAEAEIICKTPNSYLMVMGDAVDGMWWNPGQMEQMEQAPEQFKYINSLFEMMAKEKKLLVAWGGDHDGWAKKMGLDPYAEFTRRFNAYYMQGVGHVNLKVGEQNYKLCGAHKLPGFSMYNMVHAEMRLSNDVQGADIYIGAHTHKKGQGSSPIQDYGGESRTVNFISLGTYKCSDNYSRKEGWSDKTEKAMFGVAIKLYKDHKQVKYYESILEGNGKRLERIAKGWYL